MTTNNETDGAEQYIEKPKLRRYICGPDGGHPDLSHTSNDDLLGYVGIIEFEENYSELFLSLE